MTTDLTRDDARAIARVLYAVHQRRAARLAAEARNRDTDTDTAPGGEPDAA